MKRTIFEIPTSFKISVTNVLDNYPVTYEIKPLSGHEAEISVTHSKSQDYLLIHIEDQISALIGNSNESATLSQ